MCKIHFASKSSIAFFYIGSVTARHSSSERQPKFAAWFGRAAITWYFRVTSCSLLMQGGSDLAAQPFILSVTMECTVCKIKRFWPLINHRRQQIARLWNREELTIFRKVTVTVGLRFGWADLPLVGNDIVAGVRGLASGLWFDVVF